MIFDAALSQDQKHILLAGSTRESKTIESRVWLLWCDRRGHVERERILPGDFPQVAGPLADGTLAMVYDRPRRDLFPHNTVAAIGANLNPVWSKDVDISFSGILFPSICKTAPDRFVVAGVFTLVGPAVWKRELRVREYDAQGNQLRSFDISVEGSNQHTAVVGNDKQIFVAVTAFDEPHWRKTGMLYALTAVD